MSWLHKISQSNYPPLYHGTKEDFPDNLIETGRRMFGIHLTTDPDVAKIYGTVKHYTLKPNTKVLDLSDGEALWAFMEKNGILSAEDINDVDLKNYVMNAQLFQYDISSNTGYADDVAKTVRGLGYDAFKMPDQLGGGDDIAWVVVNSQVLIPTQ